MSVMLHSVEKIACLTFTVPTVYIMKLTKEERKKWV